MVDPTIITPTVGAPVEPYGNVTPSLLRPQGFNCLAGTVPTKPAFSAPAFYNTMLSVHSVYLDGAKSGNICFFGDSITQQLNIPDVSPYGLNFGISGNTPEGVLFKLDQYAEALIKARAVSVMIGINSLRTASPAISTVEDYMMRILNWISGPLIWTKIIHTGSPEPDYNTNIDTVNTYIAGQLASRPLTSIVDINPVIAPSGPLLPQYRMSDGLHLNGAGNEVWAAALRAALKTI